MKIEIEKLSAYAGLAALVFWVTEKFYIFNKLESILLCITIFFLLYFLDTKTELITKLIKEVKYWGLKIVSFFINSYRKFIYTATREYVNDNFNIMSINITINFNKKNEILDIFYILANNRLVHHSLPFNYKIIENNNRSVISFYNDNNHTIKEGYSFLVGKTIKDIFIESENNEKLKNYIKYLIGSIDSNFTETVDTNIQNNTSISNDEKSRLKIRQ